MLAPKGRKILKPGDTKSLQMCPKKICESCTWRVFDACCKLSCIRFFHGGFKICTLSKVYFYLHFFAIMTTTVLFNQFGRREVYPSLFLPDKKLFELVNLMDLAICFRWINELSLLLLLSF